MSSWQRHWLRAIPPVNMILTAWPDSRPLTAGQRPLATAAVAEVLKRLRVEVQSAPPEAPPLHLRELREAVAAGRSVLARYLAQQAARHLAAEFPTGGSSYSLSRVINATGVILHTNLGRAPLAATAAAGVAEVAARYSNLELDLTTGERGERHNHIERLLCRLTGAEAGIVVNNNAAAVLLALSSLCYGRAVLVSRGELVEIGGSFRVPDIMVQGGAQLVEVGTTNKTYVSDYAGAIGPDTGALLRVHRSNFQIVGFTATPDLSDLAALARAHDLPLLVDWGSGTIADLTRWGLPRETTMPELIAAGADLVTFSGDKLLGGPQAGFIVGKRMLVERCRRHPLARALRIDKLALAGIEATLRIYMDAARAEAEIPILRMLSSTPAQLRRAALRLARLIRAAVPGEAVIVQVQAGQSQIGGGAMPVVNLPTALVSVEANAVPVHRLAAGMRAGTPPVLARVSQQRLLLDPRTMWPDDLPLVAAAIGQVLAGSE